MKTIQNSLFLAVMILMFGTSCKKDWLGVRGEGPIITENRAINGFTGVDYHLDGRVNIVRDSNTFVLVTTYGNYQPLVHTYVSGGKLVVNSNKTLRDDEITIEVHMPLLESMSMAGSGKMSTIGQFTGGGMSVQMSGSGTIDYYGNVQSIRANMSGSGNILLTGSAQAGTMTMSGSGSIHAYGMPCESNEATISGSGTIETTTNATLVGTISGSGTIRYRGNPAVTSHISGSGEIVHY